MKFLTAIAAAGMLAATPVLARSCLADEQAKAGLHHQANADAARAHDAKVDAQVQAGRCRHPMPPMRRPEAK